jgi:putative hydrolase of the HAD superfamily
MKKKEMGFEEKYKTDNKYYDNIVYHSQKVKMYRLKHWIFDFGGVMVESVQTFPKVLNFINEDLGITILKYHPHVIKNKRRLSSGRLTAREFLENLIKKFYTSKTKNPKEVDIEPYLEFWFQKYSELIQISPKMEEIVKRLHRAGYHVSLMSNTNAIHAKSNELKGFFDLFDNVFLSNELKMRKPDIEKYKYVLKKLNSKPKEAIFIDDKLMNLVPAVKLGINIIRFESFIQFKRYLSDLGIDEITKGTRDDISKKYKVYKSSKKTYKKSKKDVKLIKRELEKLKRERKMPVYKTIYRKLEKELQFRAYVYMKKKNDFKKQEQIKKEYLKPKLKLEQSEDY